MSVIKGLRAATARSPTIRKAVTVGALAASGGLAAGEDVQSVARKLSAVDRCIEVLSDSMAKLPNFVIDNRSREHVPHDILYLLNVRPNEAMTPAIRKKVLETSRLEGGNGYDWIIRDPSTGLPKELIPVPWQLVQQWHDEIGRIWYDVTHPLTGELMRLPNEDVCHYWQYGQLHHRPGLRAGPDRYGFVPGTLRHQRTGRQGRQSLDQRRQGAYRLERSDLRRGQDQRL
jgi:phage portal protein BeeE